MPKNKETIVPGDLIKIRKPYKATSFYKAERHGENEWRIKLHEIETISGKHSIPMMANISTFDKSTGLVIDEPMSNLFLVLFDGTTYVFSGAHAIRKHKQRKTK